MLLCFPHNRHNRSFLSHFLRLTCRSFVLYRSVGLKVYSSCIDLPRRFVSGSVGERREKYATTQVHMTSPLLVFYCFTTSTQGTRHNWTIRELTDRLSGDQPPTRSRSTLQHTAAHEMKNATESSQGVSNTKRYSPLESEAFLINGLLAWAYRTQYPR